MPGLRLAEGEVCHAERGSPRWSCWTVRRGWSSSRDVRSRTSLVIWGYRRNGCASTSAKPKRMKACVPDLPTSVEPEETRELRREAFELRRANRLCLTLGVSAPAYYHAPRASGRPATSGMTGCAS